MPAPTVCQLLIDPPADGAWNMAVDEVLLAAAANSEQPTLRFYQWQRPTLSLGYFQKYADRSQHPSSQSADVVRRLSGGGAILHDQELTYSFSLPASHALSRDTQALYDAVHRAIVTTLGTLLPSDSLWQPALCDPSTEFSAEEEPFLCFERRSTGDILLRKKEASSDSPTEITAHKIVGSAQRRHRGVILQHGSILLFQSKVAPELKGFADITQHEISPADLLARLPNQIAKSLSLDLTESSLSNDLAAQARELEQKKYQVANWTERR